LERLGRPRESQAVHWIGPADDHELLPVEALGLEPDSSITRSVGPIEPL
jgi:hypothetical protein